MSLKEKTQFSFINQQLIFSLDDPRCKEKHYKA